ncbi:Catabolic L-serine/threonine dehydratase [Nakaseomyces bracarensis]|uniref:L-serine ammonia-lyase n=1 Tax=Nakaseomyces bracarensis TaxID=273131 RepID=A0ABR4NYI9_9SACH
MSIYNRTPLIRQVFPSLPQMYLKHECFQPGGSFKSRGIGNLIMKQSQRILNGKGGKKPMVFASSGGNAGLAAATASKQLNLPCTVVIPVATKQRMADKIRATGANVIVSGNHWKEADNYLKTNILNQLETLGQNVEPIYVHPFDNPEIWEGHASMVDEIVEDFTKNQIPLNKIKGIVCSVGGGGLYNGIIQGLEKYNLADKIPLVGVETRGCHVFNTSLMLDRVVSFKKITSIATSLGTANISKEAFNYAKKYGTKSVVLDDIDVIKTCLRYTQDFNMVIEPACGASLHLAYNTDILENALEQKLTADDIVVMIACGGSSTTIQDLEETLARLNHESKKNSEIFEDNDINTYIHPSLMVN